MHFLSLPEKHSVLGVHVSAISSFLSSVYYFYLLCTFFPYLGFWGEINIPGSLSRPVEAPSSPSSLFRPETDKTLQHPEYSISRTHSPLPNVALFSRETVGVYAFKKDSFQGIKFSA
ncbi:hypothetical protein NPIL_623811 [Nephila pilipes]|uniref:Uncharacterized protein n=1 Tax=Nephila pilipes TaxID=299642 RepID=A0A8X6U3H8_NEPPI|nr:hypothetical protein NPIL_623811 [Nephila pilipes]